jgi:Rod binding domain-containing protein
MATLPIDPAQAQAAAGDAEMRAQKLALEGMRKNLKSGPDADKKLKQACEGFESIFLNKLWSQMRSTVPKEGYLHSKEEEAYVSMFDQELMKKMSAAGGIGLGKMLYENLSDHLAKASAGTAARVAGKTEIGPLHPEEKGIPLSPEAAALNLKPGDRRDGETPSGMELNATDANRLGAAKLAAKGVAVDRADASSDEPAAAVPVVFPPGFRGPDAVPPQGPEDLAALDQALELARRVEGGRTTQRAVQAYRDAAQDEGAVSAPQFSPSYVTPLAEEPGEEEPGT